MKALDIIKTANGNMLSSKLRTFLTIIAIFIGAFTLTLTNGIGSGISKYLDEQIGSLGAKDILVIQPKQDNASGIKAGDTAEPKKYDPNKITTASGFGFAIPVLAQKDIDIIKKIDGIKSVVAQRSVSPTYVFGPNSNKFELTASEFIDGTNLAMTEGKGPDNSSSESQIALPFNYVSALGFSSNAEAVGKTVTIAVTDATGKLSEATATVVGIPQKSLVSQGAASVNSAFFSKLYDMESVGLPPASVNKFVQVTARFDPTYNDQQLTDLKNRHKDKGYTGQTVQDTLGIIKQVINGIVLVFDMFAIIALIAASFGVINTLLMAVQERTKEIGLMKAMGMGRGRIFFLFSTEAILLGFWGSLLGVLAAYGAGQLINSIATKTFLKDFVGLTLLTFPLQSIFIIVGVIMLITFLAGTLPARRASKLDPIEALRYE